MKNKKKVRYDGAAPLPILSFLLSICASLMYTICRSQFVPCLLAMGALTTGIFILFYKVRSKPVVTTLALLALLLAAWGTGSAAGAYSTGDDSFMTFLFTASAQFELIYAVAAVVIFSLVLGFIGCYFSVISPRPCFLMLLMFIPLILSFRTSRELPVYFTLIMAGCFIFACQNLAVPLPADASAQFEDKSARRRRMALSCVAAAVIGVVSALLPRANSAPVSDMLDNIVPQDHGYFNTAGLTNFASRSSVNTGSNDPSGELLFTVGTEHPGCLKRWAFDSYDENGWTALDEMNTGYPGWEYNAQAVDHPEFFARLLSNSDKLMERNQQLLEGVSPYYTEDASTMIAVRDNSSTRVVIHPWGTYRALLPEQCGRTYRTPRDDIFTENTMPVNCSYILRQHVGTPDPELLRRLDTNSMQSLLSDAYYSDIITSSEYSAMRAEMEEAENYAGYTDDIPESIRSLTDEITAGIASDYDKAMALEKWFGEAGFVYDMEFIPEEKGVEYFLFESRRGICSDFAAALTLMARAAGIPTQYCEGFAVTPDTYDEATGLYNITDAQAHAWPQVYIPGAGWLDIDGTRYAEPARKDEGLPAFLLYILAGAMAAAILVFIFRKPLGWAAFCVTYPMKSQASRVRGVYLRARRLAADIDGKSEQSLSTGDVRRILSDRLGMPAEAAEICSAADELFYSPAGKPTASDLLKPLRALKKRRRRLK